MEARSVVVLLRARVGFRVCRFQPLNAGVRVDLRGADTRMAEEFLHCTKFRTGVEEVRGERVAQRVYARAFRRIHQ